MEKTSCAVKHLVFETNHQAYELSADMIKLEVVQNAIGKLMERIDEITYNKWNEDPSMARLSIDEIKDTVRLIEMAFYPLYLSLNAGVNKLDSHTSELFDIFAKRAEIIQVGELDDKKSPKRHGNDE